MKWKRAKDFNYFHDKGHFFMYCTILIFFLYMYSTYSYHTKTESHKMYHKNICSIYIDYMRVNELGPHHSITSFKNYYCIIIIIIIIVIIIKTIHIFMRLEDKCGSSIVANSRRQTKNKSEPHARRTRTNDSSKD